MLNIQQQTNRQNHTSTTNLQNEMKKQGPLGVDNKIQDQVKTLLLQGGADLALTAKIASVKVKFFKYCQGKIFFLQTLPVLLLQFFQRFPMSRYNFVSTNKTDPIAIVKIQFF